MRAVYYEKVKEFSIREIPKPVPKDHEVLVKIHCCSICKTDVHQHNGSFIAKFPLIPGHEMAGTVEAVGKDVTTIQVGDRVTVDDSGQCHTCYYCQNDKPLFCENFSSKGATEPGAMAEYVTADFDKVFRLADHISFEEGCLTEPTACAIHGMDMIDPKNGDEVLLFGSGGTGIILAQLLNHSNAGSVAVAAPTRSKLELLKELGIRETYQISRDGAAACREEILKNHPHGFDIVVDATGSAKVAEEAIQYLKKDGRLVLYAVYRPDARISISPDQFMQNQFRIIGSFAQCHCFPRAVQAINNGIVNLKKLVTSELPLEEFGKGLEMAEKGGEGVIKIVIKP